MEALINEHEQLKVALIISDLKLNRLVSLLLYHPRDLLKDLIEPFSAQQIA